MAWRGYCDIIGDGGVHDRVNDRPSHHGYRAGMGCEMENNQGSQSNSKFSSRQEDQCVGSYPKIERRRVPPGDCAQ